MRPFSEIHQQAQQLSVALTKVQDEAVIYFVQHLDGHVYTFIASLSAQKGVVGIEYEITKDNLAVQALKELPTEIMASYGIFLSNVEEWKNGGELHESLRP